MRVLLYTGTREWTATARVLLTAARGLLSRGHTVTVGCYGQSRLEALANEAGLETVAVDRAWFAGGVTWDLRKVLQSRFIEVAIVTSQRDHGVVASAMRFAERGAVLRRVAAFEPFDESKVSRLSLRIAPAGLLFTGNEEFTDPQPQGWAIPAVVAPMGLDTGALDGIDPAVRSDIGAPPEGPLIVCDYHESGRARLGTLFRTLALLAPRHAHLHAVVLGPGSLDDALCLHAASVGVGRLVTFLGERSDARRVMRAADAGWVVASGDAGAFSCLEFMALRVPVIADRQPLTERFVADGITGVLLRSDEPSYTASKVAAFLTSADKRVTMANAARARVQREFSESAMINGFDRAVVAAGDRTAWATT